MSSAPRCGLGHSSAADGEHGGSVDAVADRKFWRPGAMRGPPGGPTAPSSPTLPSHGAPRASSPLLVSAQSPGPYFDGCQLFSPDYWPHSVHSTSNKYSSVPTGGVRNRHSASSSIPKNTDYVKWPSAITLGSIMEDLGNLPRKRPRRLLSPRTWCSPSSASAVLVLLFLASFFGWCLYDRTSLGGWTPSKPPLMDPSQPTVVLRQGVYVGELVSGQHRFRVPIEAFRGVPYAETTEGQNRFRPPVPLNAGNGTFAAVKFGNHAPPSNDDGPIKAAAPGEDCLNLNFYRPQLEGGYDRVQRKLPIVIYVHGGAFNGGRGVERNMGTFISWAEKPILALNFNYRVGALGFLPSSLTAKEGLLNLGLKDQQLFFQWVKENAEALGGDPDNITIMGLSAGAHSVGHHLMYYNSTNAPFHKAIMESGATTARAVLAPDHPRHLTQFREFLMECGIDDSVPESQIFDRLRELPLYTITRASRTVFAQNSDAVTWPFQPVIDGPYAGNISYPGPDGGRSSPRPGEVIPTAPITAWRVGRHLRIPVITGFNTNEGVIFVPKKVDSNAAFRTFFKNLIPALGPDDLDALEDLYPDPGEADDERKTPFLPVPSGRGLQFLRLDRAYSHYAYICPVLQTAHFMSEAKNNSSGTGAKDSRFSVEGREPDTNASSPPVYVYQFAALGSETGTANHGAEAPLVAHDLVPGQWSWSPGVRKLSKAMHRAWSRFVISPEGDPNAVPESPMKPRPVEGASSTRADNDKDDDDDVDDEMVYWPTFRSPFVTSARKQAARKSNGGQDRGLMMVWGEGNDEQMGRHGSASEGTIAAIQSMSEDLLRACEFWWERIELSEGLGSNVTAKL